MKMIDYNDPKALEDVIVKINKFYADNYYQDDDPEKDPIKRWRAHANLLYSNWLNYFVYQTTPYDLSDLNR